MLPENIYQGSLSAIFDQIDKRRLTKVWVHLTSSQGVTTAQLAIAVTIAWSAATSKLLGIPKISWCTPTQNKEEEEKHPKNSSCVPSNFLHLLTPCLGHSYDRKPDTDLQEWTCLNTEIFMTWMRTEKVEGGQSLVPPPWYQGKKILNDC